MPIKITNVCEIFIRDSLLTVSEQLNIVWMISEDFGLRDKFQSVLHLPITEWLILDAGVPFRILLKSVVAIRLNV